MSKTLYSKQVTGLEISSVDELVGKRKWVITLRSTKAGHDLIKLFWHSETLLQKFKPISEE